MFACFGGGPPVVLREDNPRAVEEAAWLRRMLEKEQQARAAAEQALAAERLRNALLEREVLAAAQAAQDMGDSLCAFLSTGRDAAGASLDAAASNGGGAQLPFASASPGNPFSSPGGWSAYSAKGPGLERAQQRQQQQHGHQQQLDDSARAPPGAPRDQARGAAGAGLATPPRPLPCDEPNVGGGGGPRRGGASRDGLHQHIVEMSARLKGFASEWVSRLEAMEELQAQAGAAGAGAAPGARPRSAAAAAAAAQPEVVQQQRRLVQALAAATPSSGSGGSAGAGLDDSPLQQWRSSQEEPLGPRAREGPASAAVSSEDGAAAPSRGASAAPSRGASAAPSRSASAAPSRGASAARSGSSTASSRATAGAPPEPALAPRVDADADADADAADAPCPTPPGAASPGGAAPHDPWHHAIPGGGPELDAFPGADGRDADFVEPQPTESPRAWRGVAGSPSRSAASGPLSAARGALRARRAGAPPAAHHHHPRPHPAAPHGWQGADGRLSQSFSRGDGPHDPEAALRASVTSPLITGRQSWAADPEVDLPPPKKPGISRAGTLGMRTLGGASRTSAAVAAAAAAGAARAPSDRSGRWSDEGGDGEDGTDARLAYPAKSARQTIFDAPEVLQLGGGRRSAAAVAAVAAGGAGEREELAGGGAAARGAAGDKARERLHALNEALRRLHSGGGDAAPGGEGQPEAKPHHKVQWGEPGAGGAAAASEHAAEQDAEQEGRGGGSDGGGLDATGSSAASSVPPPPRQPWAPAVTPHNTSARPPRSAAILYGSQTGTAREIALALHAKAGRRGVASEVFGLDELGFANFGAARTPVAVVITSSTGDGDPPDNAARFFKGLCAATTGRLAGVSLALLGLGDSRYARFQGAPRSLRALALGLGAAEFCEAGEADDAEGLERTVDPWCENLWAALKAALLDASGASGAAAAAARALGPAGTAAENLAAEPSAESSGDLLAQLTAEASRPAVRGGEGGGGAGAPRVTLEMAGDGGLESGESGMGGDDAGGDAGGGGGDGVEGSLEGRGSEGGGGDADGSSRPASGRALQEAPEPPGGDEEGPAEQEVADAAEGAAAGEEQPGSAVLAADGQEEEEGEGLAAAAAAAAAAASDSQEGEQLVQAAEERQAQGGAGGGDDDDDEGGAGAAAALPEGALVGGVAPEGVDLVGAPGLAAPRIEVDFDVSPEAATHARARELSRPSLEQRDHRDPSGEYSALRPFWARPPAVHVELDAAGSGMAWRAGDAIGVLPQNDPGLVEGLLARLGLDGDAVFQVKAAGGADPPLPHVEWPCTLRRAFTCGVDVAGQPQRALLRLLAEHCGDEGDKRTLLFLSAKAGRDDYAREVAAGRPTLLDLLDRRAPPRFPSCAPPLAALLDALPPLAPRAYALSAAPRAAGGGRLEFAFSAETVQAAGGQRAGVATGWLMRLLAPWLEEGGAGGGAAPPAEAWAPVLLRRRDALAALAAQPPSPLVLVGAGAGVAPLRALLQQRAAAAAAGGGTAGGGGGGRPRSNDPGEVWVYAGCRRREEDFLYGDEFGAAEAAGCLARLRVACGRGAADGRGRVPQLLRHDGAALAALVVRRGARVCVCGGGGAAREVHAALVAVLHAHVGMSEAEAEEELASMTEKGAYVREAWGP
ncbi:MAG: hypothetical protein J3K34DRAFT_460460 [Monoraphidium minutum]|nr:MAG: hypothetical protein J3K34DRAFT_460460 [Monoraphidium minutum]